MNIFKKGDLIVIFIVIFIIGTGLVLSSKPWERADDGNHRIAVIKQDDEIIRQIDLELQTSSEKIYIGGRYNEVILVEKGRIRFLEADCPDRICVNTGWLTREGDMAVCLPNRVMIIITGQSNSLDGITY